MNTKIFISLSLVVLFIAGACGDPQKAAIEELETEVMKVHDEVMPRMDEIYTLQKEVEKKLDDETLEDSARVVLEGVNQRLGSAAEGMMSWMRDYQPPATLTDMSQDSIYSYLQSEQKRIEKVAEDMNQSISEAESVLGKNE